jgi:hypothetical protein
MREFSVKKERQVMATIYTAASLENARNYFVLSYLTASAETVLCCAEYNH